MADYKQLTVDETLALMRAKLTEKGLDRFRMKVYRKRTMSDLAQAVATFDEASINHFASPETWLPRFGGGGPLYQLIAFHESDLTLSIGSPMLFQIANEPAKQLVDVDAVKSQTWQGPRVLVWPNPDEQPRSFQQPAYSVPSLSPGAAAGITAPQTSVPGLPSPVTLAQQEANQAFQMRLEAERQQLENARRELDLRERKMELERIQAASDARLRELEAKIAHSTQSAGMGVEKLAALAGTIMPVVTMIIQGQNEMRVAMLKAQQETGEKQTALLTTLLEKRADDTPQTKMLSSMMETMGAFTKMQTDFIQTVAESSLGGPKEEPTGLKIVRELVKGANAVAQGMQLEKSMKRPAGAAPLRALPPKPKAAPVAHAASPTAQPVSANVAGVPVAAEQQIQGLSTADKLEELIRARVHVDSVIDALMSATDPEHGDAEFKAELEAAGGLLMLFQARLGDWVNESETNAAYIQVLVPEIQKAFEEAYGAATEGAEGEADDGDDDEDAEEAVA